MHKITCDKFSLYHTLNCGQVFRWEFNPRDQAWVGVVNNTVVKAKQRGSIVTIDSTLDIASISNYFRLDDDLQRIYQEINRDQHISSAIQLYRGLRLIRQDPYECLMSYLCTTATNIPRIKLMIRNLCRTFGDPIGNDVYSFPDAETLSKATVRQLRACGLGFRAEYVLGTVRRLAKDKFDLAGLSKLDYLNAKRELEKFQGVGDKVAECVLLFSLDKLEAFPIDTWIRKLMKNYYNKTASKEIREFVATHFGKYCGYAQQYLYYHYRTMHRLTTSQN